MMHAFLYVDVYNYINVGFCLIYSHADFVVYLQVRPLWKAWNVFDYMQSGYSYVDI